ncbi:Lrp/AsnC family transcriptional regulator [Novosphingobium sp. PASSN1]|uniref:Lrp/AsnC family transcriptional regulator n=1 Tax=Novosphingobium sp. PASSN1 TaxID=2015561 RepID=UPI000BCB91C7|nr:Lrp/AsnC family transcriptional regulator [Novosphingobium sp. PASSN1]OYU35938.1 MAG: AsnC family transcriptional regulator [Novosphingobium sp. PASSN1]
MDKLDHQLLALLQTDASRPHADLARLVGLSASQVSRRIARLEADGFIRATVALLSEAALGLQVEAYVAVAMASYAPDVVRGFHERISALPEVLDCRATTGDSDYLLRIVARDLAAYSRLMNQQLLGHGDVASVRSSVVLDRIKHTTSLPLPPPVA